MMNDGQAHAGAPPAAPDVDQDSAPGVFRFSAAHFLIVLVLWFLATPFIAESSSGAISPTGTIIDGVLMSMVLLSAGLAVGGTRKAMAWAIVLVLPALAGTWIHRYRPDLVPPSYFHATGLLFVGYVVAHLFRSIVTAPKVTSEVLCASIATYLMLGLFWAFLYMIVGRYVPGSFLLTSANDSDNGMRGFTALYFSFVTLTTVGYGEIVPIAPAARMLAMSEATVGMFYITILVARLVSLYSAQAVQNGRGGRTIARGARTSAGR